MVGRGGCTTGPYRTPTALRPHYQDKAALLIYRNKHREAAKMRRQRNMAQMKEWIKTPEKELNKMEISHLSDAEFKTLVIRILKEISDDFSSIKKIQSEAKDTLIEIKNNLQGNNSIVKLRIKSMISNIRKQNTTNQNNKKEKRVQKMRKLSGLWDNVKRSNIHIIGVPEEEKEQEIGNLFEKMKENFPIWKMAAT